MPEIEYVSKGGKRLLDANTATIFVKSQGGDMVEGPDQKRRWTYRLSKDSVDGCLAKLKGSSIERVRVIGYHETRDRVAEMGINLPKQ